jgi:capsular exopolysaccharide synthesis family protein
LYYSSRRKQRQIEQDVGIVVARTATPANLTIYVGFREKEHYMNDFMEIRKIVDIILRRFWLVILISFLSAALGYTISQWQPHIYEATTTIMVGQFDETAELDNMALLDTETLVRIYVYAALRQPVLQGVVDALDLTDTWRELKTQVQAKIVEGTPMIQITAEARSTKLAQAIADEVVHQLFLLDSTLKSNQGMPHTDQPVDQQLAELQKRIESERARLQSWQATLDESEEVQSIQQIEELQTRIDILEMQISTMEANYAELLINTQPEVFSNSLVIIETANANPQPVQPQTKLNILLAGIVGVLLALGVILLLEFWDVTIKSADDISRLLGLAPLGTINSIVGKHEQNKLLLSQDSASPTMEAYRIIRSNIEFKTADHPAKSIIVTSPGVGEDKSTIVANLGIIMADAGYRTIIVDANLRQPAQHRLFGITNSKGLAEAIRSPEVNVSRLLMETKVPYLQILPSGRVPSNPAGLLGSHGMRQVLADLSQIADVVIYDSPPILGLTDTSILANRADGVVLVIKTGQTHREAARQALSNLQQARASLIGVILNGGRPKHLYYPKPEFRTTTAPAAKSALGQTD